MLVKAICSENTLTGMSFKGLLKSYKVIYKPHTLKIFVLDGGVTTQI